MFYHFNQNKSGGSFSFDEDYGITHHVIIEAGNLEDAITKAEQIGIYFDGCYKGYDCDCCGDRWHEPWKDDGKETPMIYSTPVKDYLKGDKYPPMLWMDKGKEICVHYKDGRKEWF